MTDGWVRPEDNVIDGAGMADRAARAATGFARLGVDPGDAVAWLLHNDAAVFAVTDAAGMLGAYGVPINWYLAPDEVRYILADSGAKALIGHPHLLVPLGALGIRAISLSDWPDWLAAHEPRAGLPLDPPGSMMYTSGIMGRPRGVRRQPATQAQRDTIAAFLAEIYGLHPGMVSAVTAPLYHAMMTRLAGGHLVLMGRFLSLVEEHRIGHAFMAPIMFVRLLKLPKAVRVRYDLSSLPSRSSCIRAHRSVRQSKSKPSAGRPCWIVGGSNSAAFYARPCRIRSHSNEVFAISSRSSNLGVQPSVSRMRAASATRRGGSPMRRGASRASMDTPAALSIAAITSRTLCPLP